MPTGSAHISIRIKKALTIGSPQDLFGTSIMDTETAIMARPGLLKIGY